MFFIPRGIIYHDLVFDLKYYFMALRNKNLDSSNIDVFEKKFANYMNMNHCIAFPFVRTALYYSLKMNNFKKGDEIIMPPITIKPIIDVVLNLGLKPVFVDIEKETLCFDMDKLKNAITKNTKAILITYLFGNVPKVQEMVDFCKSKELFVIEDFSHALNAKYNNKKLGTFGDLGIYSCSAIKTLDAFGGGLVITNNDKIFSYLQKCQKELKPTPSSSLKPKIMKNIIWNFATRKAVFSFFIYPLLKMTALINPKAAKKMTGARLDLKPFDVLPDLWFESFTALQAQAGMELIGKVKSEDQKRIENVNRYKEVIPPASTTVVHKGCEPVYWQFVVYPKETEAFKEYLIKNKIDNSTTNLSLVSALDIYEKYNKKCENAEFIHKNAVFIPSYHRLTEKEAEHVRLHLKKAFEQESLSK